MLNRKAEVPAVPLWRVGAFVLTLSLCFSAILTFSLLPSSFELVEGQVSPKTIKSPHTFTFVSESKTRELRDEAAAETVMQGETILRDGEVVRASHIEKLKAGGLLTPLWDWRGLLGQSLLSLLLSLILGLYLFVFQPTLLLNDRRLILLWVVVVGTVLAARLTIPGRDLYPYLFPLATAPILIASLLDLGAAITSAAILSVLVSYVAGLSQGTLGYLPGHPLNPLEMVSLYVAGSLVGVVVVRRAERLNRFFVAGASVAIVNFLMVTAFFLLKQAPEAKPIWLYAVLGLVNGSLTAAIALGVFALLGHFFGVVTGLQLLELAQPNQPLLRRLLLEAPGTYHHSIIIANMAERAAELIGADALLTRVGAYYHDVGKVLRPGFFVENQMSDENIHDRLEPRVSAATVISHVFDGLKLAKQHRLPARIRDFVAEHHGTRLAQYFYQKAQEKGEKVDLEPFRYPGPRPQSPETALVMLADSAEAMARSAKDRSPEEIDRLVDRVISQRLSEGQLDECNLTLRDLQLIKGAFKGVLRGVFHPRIEYPPTVQELEMQPQTAPSADPAPSDPRKSLNSTNS